MAKGLVLNGEHFAALYQQSTVSLYVKDERDVVYPNTFDPNVRVFVGNCNSHDE